MRIEFAPPESVTEPRLWVRPEQVFGMVLRPGSIEAGGRRTKLAEFRYAAGEMILPHRHEGKWIGLMNAPHLQVSISDAALMAASDTAHGEVELRTYQKFADPRLRGLVAAVHTEGGCRLSKWTAASGFSRTVDSHSVGQSSCSNPAAGADIQRGTRLRAHAKD